MYDKLTLARAAQIGSHVTSKSARQSRQLNRSRERTMIMPLKAHDLEQTTITVGMSMTMIDSHTPFPDEKKTLHYRNNFSLMKAFVYSFEQIDMCLSRLHTYRLNQQSIIFLLHPYCFALEYLIEFNMPLRSKHDQL